MRAYFLLLIACSLSAGIYGQRIDRSLLIGQWHNYQSEFDTFHMAPDSASLAQKIHIQLGIRMKDVVYTAADTAEMITNARREFYDFFKGYRSFDSGGRAVYYDKISEQKTSGTYRWVGRNKISIQTEGFAPSTYQITTLTDHKLVTRARSKGMKYWFVQTYVR